MWQIVSLSRDAITLFLTIGGLVAAKAESPGDSGDKQETFLH